MSTDMQFTTLGRTGISVSVAGLGCGGFSRLGQSRGATVAESVAVVRAAMDRGVNFLDTAENYGTEEIVGQAVAEAGRDKAVISSKTNIVRGGERRSPEDVVASLHSSLERLGTDYVDVYHLHGVAPKHVEFAIEAIAPALEKEREAGRIRHLGITETAPNDPTHITLGRAIRSGLFDVVMVAFHLLHQNARSTVFQASQAEGVGTLLMFAVRLIFSHPDRLRAELRERAALGEIPSSVAEHPHPLEFLYDVASFTGAADGDEELAHKLAVIDAAYRYARHEAGVDVVLFGTGNVAHLEPNITSILAPPLPGDTLERIEREFGHLVGLGLDAPNAASSSKP